MGRATPMTTLSNWDWQAVSRKFFELAQEAYREAGEARMRRDPAHRAVHDEQMAKFAVYSYLHDKSFLARREDLLTELRHMLDDPVTQRPTGVVDTDSFDRSRNRWIRELILELESWRKVCPPDVT
jgi:hypothetical protein